MKVQSFPLGGVAQLVRASGSYPLGHPFKSGRRYHVPREPIHGRAH